MKIDLVACSVPVMVGVLSLQKYLLPTSQADFFYLSATAGVSLNKMQLKIN
jgi:hypothetical protein